MNSLDDWILSIKNSNKLIVVEGKKDKAALSQIGLTNILTINRPLFAMVEQITSLCKECILLLDLDTEGRKIYSYLKKNLERNGVKVDNKYREFLFKHTKLTNIEGLRNYL